METKLIRNLGLKLGAVAGVLGIAYFFALYLSGAMLFDPFYKFDFWVCIPFIIGGLLMVRKSSDSLRIWQGFVLGFYVMIMSAAVISTFYYIFLFYIQPDFIKLSFEARLDLLNDLLLKFQLENNEERIKFLTDAIEGNKKIGQKGMTPFDFALDKIFWQYLIGGIVTFIGSILFRK